MKELLTILAVIFISNTALSETINPNIKHDWENSRYTTNANNTVVDNKTNLIWKKCSQGLSDSICTTGSATIQNWQEALDIADTSTFAGFSDWRLPNIKELRSIAAYDRYDPSINSDIFPNTPNSYFWSSSPYVSSSNEAWGYNFGTGFDDYVNRNNNYYVRLVRGGQ